MNKTAFIFGLGLALLFWIVIPVNAADPMTPRLRPLRQQPGDPLPEIKCGTAYTASLYTHGLSGADGLAFSPSGILYVAEENAGQVSQIGATGAFTPFITGLSNPEGINFDRIGNLYVVEDVQNGRLLRATAGGITTTIVSGLDAPEGVVISPDGLIYVTESNAQFVSDPFSLQSHITVVDNSGTVTRLMTSLPIITGGPLVFDVEFLSYAGITLGNDGLLYATNETSNHPETQSNPPFTANLTTTKSIRTLEPSTHISTVFSLGLYRPEGLHFLHKGNFPLYVAEEYTTPGQGRLSIVASDGSSMPFCTGFGLVEDVEVDGNGWLYVSEDTGGRVIRIKPLSADYSSLGDSYGPAWHILSSIRLGTQNDADAGVGSDTNDGVARNPGDLWQSGNTVNLTVTVQGGSGYLAAWFDWNRDGDFESTEQGFGQSVNAGTTSFALNIPASYATGQDLSARFRLYDSSGAASAIGEGVGGEVEDYTWAFGPNSLTLSGMRGNQWPAIVSLGMLLLCGALGASLVLKDEKSHIV